METEAPTRAWPSLVAAVLACVILPLATVSVWLDQRVTDTDAYVDAVGPLAEDPDVQRLVAARVETAVVAALPLDRLPAVAAANAETAVHTVVLAVITSPSFPPAWREANREAHAQLIGALRDEPGAVAPDGGVDLDLAAIAGSALAELETRGLFTGEVPVDASVRVLDADQLDKARRGYRVLDALGLWLPLIWLVLVAVAVLLSPRRGRTVGTLAIGSLVSMLVLLALLALSRSVAVDAVPRADQDLAGEVWDVVTASLHTAVLVLIAMAGGVLLLRVASRALARQN